MDIYLHISFFHYKRKHVLYTMFLWKHKKTFMKTYKKHISQIIIICYQTRLNTKRSMIRHTLLSLDLRVSPASFCKQSRTRSGPTKHRVWSGSKLLTLWWYSWKDFSKRLISKKKSQMTKNMKNFERGKELIFRCNTYFIGCKMGFFSIPKQERSIFIKHPDKSA